MPLSTHLGPALTQVLSTQISAVATGLNPSLAGTLNPSPINLTSSPLANFVGSKKVVTVCFTFELNIPIRGSHPFPSSPHTAILIDLERCSGRMVALSSWIPGLVDMGRLTVRRK